MRRSTTTAPPQNSGRFVPPAAGRSHAECIADLLDRLTVDAETIDQWERATPQRRQ